jgi:hypothetical protein
MEYFEVITDAQTGEVTTRPLTDVEIAALNQPPTPEERIAELKQFLRDTDYVALSDYDKDKPEILLQRQAWREEIRQLEGGE